MLLTIPHMAAEDVVALVPNTVAGDLPHCFYAHLWRIDDSWMSQQGSRRQKLEVDHRLYNASQLDQGVTGRRMYCR